MSLKYSMGRRRKLPPPPPDNFPSWQGAAQRLEAETINTRLFVISNILSVMHVDDLKSWIILYLGRMLMLLKPDNIIRDAC